ncbi:hypothetical protein OPKNFCMD_0781 [Methylobacterium crusticola]|uniref:Uncharacterized protein n=1 Tax=Methylobacterium crusticola TaxID=1697972 RepID=A0ABQ4QT44_9HYPH|nr:hypothetical protein [Methylobacterium crusticola]GJD48065.1 hypothetical protein OPKNFCMD_0781 [Methylobacterium crusticola]
MADARARRTGSRDWPSVFLRAVLSLFVGLPVGGVLYGLGHLAVAIYRQDPVLQHPWALGFGLVADAVSYVFLGGFAWSPEAGYRSLHGYYAAGVALSFVILGRPWRRGAGAPEAWPRTPQAG